MKSRLATIMQVCGGNAGLLHKVAVAVKADKDSKGGDMCTWNFDEGEWDIRKQFLVWVS